MEKDCTLVSVIIPVYGVEKYIKESILSVIHQTYQNIEIILVDDETKDNSIVIAENELKKHNTNYKIVKEINRGLPGARNNGVSFASGAYLCFIDSDDIISIDHIENMIRFAIDKKLKVVFSDFEYTNELNRNGKDDSDNGHELHDRLELFDFFMKRKPAIHCCSLLIHRELFENGIMFNEKLKYGEDVDFMWRIFSNIDLIGHIKKKTYKYLVRKNSIMTSLGIQKGKIFVDEFKNTILLLIKEYPENKNIYTFVYYRTVLGWLNAVARSSPYNLFVKSTKLVSVKDISKELKSFPDYKIRILSYILLHNKKLFYLLNNRGKKIENQN